MGKILLATGTTIEDVTVNGDGFETTVEVDPAIFTFENLKRVTFQDDERIDTVAEDAKLAFFFTTIEGETQEYRFGFYTVSDETIRDQNGVSYLAQLLLTDEQAVAAPFLFDEWDPNSVSYTAEVSKVTYNDLLYKCLQSHVSQASWNPADAVSLWVRIDDPAIEWPEWRQPTGAHDAYPIGAKVSHNDKHWVSNTDNNTWEPGVFGWDEQVEESEL